MSEQNMFGTTLDVVRSWCQYPQKGWEARALRVAMSLQSDAQEAYRMNQDELGRKRLNCSKYLNDIVHESMVWGTVTE